MKTIALIPTILLGTLLSAAAQGPQGPPPDPVGMILDKNQDQKLSAREIKNAAKQLSELDENNDSAISAEELKPEQPKGERRRKRDRDSDEEKRGNPPPSSALLAALDTDKSGDLSKQEIAAASESLATLDTDDDGELSSDESGIQEAPSARGEGGPRGGGPLGPPRGGPRR